MVYSILHVAFTFMLMSAIVFGVLAFFIDFVIGGDWASLKRAWLDQ